MSGALRPASLAKRIPTLGRLLQCSAADLRAFLTAEEVDRIVTVLAGRGFELAQAPRSNVRDVYFSARWILDREEMAEEVTRRP